MYSTVKLILRRYLQVIPLVTLISGTLIVILYHFLYPERVFLPLHILGTAFVYTSVFTLFLVPVFQMLDYHYPLKKKHEVVIHIMVQGGISIGCYFVAFNISEWLFPVEQYMTGSDQFINFIFSMFITFTVIVIFYLQLFIRRGSEANEKAVKSEIAALRAQVNPHFLFNSLNSIASLVKTHPDKAEVVTEDLAELFRYSLQSSKVQEVSLGEEIRAAKIYFGIEKARFGNDIELHIEMEPNLKVKKVPALILQPLVENAVKHGYQQTGGPFRIDVNIYTERETVIISVSDSGFGFGSNKEDDVFKRGTGLSNIRDRLQLHYGRGADIKLNRKSVKITFPIE